MSATAAEEPRAMLLLRGAQAEDWPFIRDSWRESAKDAGLASLGLSKDALRASAKAKCACKGETSDCASCAPSWAMRRALSCHLKEQHNRLSERLERRAAVVVAVAEDDPAQILGYVLFERTQAGPLVHWLYVRHQLRRLGVGTVLMGAIFPAGPRSESGRYTTHTQAGARLAELFGLRFSPEEKSA